MEEIKVKDLIQDQHNFNQGTAEGEELMNKSLSRLGAGRSILVDKKGNIIAGNKTQKAAINAGIEDAIVVHTTGDKLVVVQRDDVDIDSKVGRELAYVDNKSAQINLAWDEAELQSYGFLEGIDMDSIGVDANDIPDAETEVELQQDDPNVTEEDGFEEQEQEIETRVKSGEVWQLGEHRLMCGDSTKAEDVKALMNGEQADLWLTDPPYNVNYSEGKNDVSMAANGKELVHKDIANDNMSDASFKQFLVDAYSAAKTGLKEGGAFYIWTAQGHNLVTFAIALDAVGMPFRQQIIWRKNALVLGRSDYQWIHEPCFYGWKPGAGHYFINVRNETTVIPDAEELNIDKMAKKDMQDLLHKIFDSDIPTSVINENKPQKSELHPTMKPVRLFGRLIHNSAKRGDIVLDTFGGSGTTLIACEQLGRRCRMMELDPHYCDVILTRWEKLTGKTAVKL